MRSRSGYFLSLAEAASSILKGLRITLKHFVAATHSASSRSISAPTYFDDLSGISTVAYPHESLPVPDNGRYRLHNEIDDCIVCDKCAKICPVDCIEIEAIKSVGEFGKTSDGTPKRIYAARFDIDMAKCCFCGLCTTVCPTECLTMTKVYDFSVTDIRQHNFAFGEMTDTLIAEKRLALEQFQQSKPAITSSITPSVSSPSEQNAPSQAPTKTVFKPKIKPPDTPSSS